MNHPSDDEMREAISGTAPYANKIYITSFDVGARLSFCEGNTSLPTALFRAAVFISWSEVAALRDLLNEQLKNLEVAKSQKAN